MSAPALPAARPMLAATLLAWLWLLFWPTAAAAEENRRGRASLTELATQVEQVAGQVRNAEGNLRLVETQYTQRPEPTDEEALMRRFGDGELQYLLGNHAGAALLFHDVISDARFRQSPRYPDALFYLGDSLFQQQNLIGARRYLGELLARKDAPHYREALARYLEIASRLNEFTGVDEYIHQARGAGGELSPELAYIYGKWLFKRADGDRGSRLARAVEAFRPLAEDPAGAYHLQAAYFLGVIELQRAQGGDYSAALEHFRRIVQAPARDEREAKVKEMANLSLGRLLYESGKYDEALDRYQEVPRESENFPESLYEIAWVHVRKGEWQRAKEATDILLLVASESTLAPEAKILQGHLLLKLKSYGEASETYSEVINTYAPVRDELDALLTVNKDPVAYFEGLLSRNERSMDVTSLLPPVALKWATTQREVADAVRMVGDLDSGRRGVDESQDIAERILRTLDERGLETFPELQEGYTRADAVDSALTQFEHALARLEGYLVEDALEPGERTEHGRLRAELDEYQRRFASLPTNQAEVEARRERMRAEASRVDKDAFKLGYELQSLRAVKAAIDKWLEDTRPQRQGSSSEEERAFAEQLRQEGEALAGHQAELEEIRQALAVERSSADAALAGEDALRAQYLEVLGRQHALIATGEARLSAERARVIERAHEVRAQLAALRERSAAAKTILRRQVANRGRQIREKVKAEMQLLSGYARGVADLSGDASNLVGRIAFDSFRRVRQQFYELVLKADVGIVDVAFTRKQDKTSEIQKMASQKDRELRALDEEFKEVLKDVD